jgi:hypothetical protein
MSELWFGKQREHWRGLYAVWLLAIAAVLMAAGSPAQPGTTERVSVSSSEEEGNDCSALAAISADGRFVAFDSYASNLVAGDTNEEWDVFVRDRLLGTTERVSASSSGEQGNGESGWSSISADGRFVAFDSYASNLVAGDTNEERDVFVRDRLLGTTERVSVSSSGYQGNGGSAWSSVSADGQFVAFESCASNLVAGDTNEEWDVFVRDRQSGTTERVSVSSWGYQGNDHSLEAAISADGRFVAFDSYASNLVAGDTNEEWDVFVRDRLLGTTERASVSSSGEQGNGDSGHHASASTYWGLSMSADGRFVAFMSCASNLVPGDTNAAPDVFVRDRDPDEDGIFDEGNGTTERVSVSSSGEQATDYSYWPSIDADGRFVAFLSGAPNLVPFDTNGYEDVFVRDRLLGTTERVSVSVLGEQGNSPSYWPSISGDGRFVAFTSYASNLVPYDMNGNWDVFVRDRHLETTERVSVSSSGGEGNNRSEDPAISLDGRFVAFMSTASNLVSDDTNWEWDVFVRDRQLGTTELVSISSCGEQGDMISSWPSISADGRFVAFHSGATNLVPDDTNGYWDVFVRDRMASTTERISLSYSGEQGDYDSHTYSPSISVDGRFVAFSSRANLVPGDTFLLDAFVRDREARWYEVFGTVTFQDLDASATPPSSLGVCVTWNGWPFGCYDVDLAPDGSYSLLLPAGSLTLSIKHTHWLRQTMVADNSSGPVSGIDFSLVNGDCFDDNAVDLLDLTQVLAHFGEPDGLADINESGLVDLPDLSIVLVNFGKVGDG